jgi:hypothetical protein
MLRAHSVTIQPSAHCVRRTTLRRKQPTKPSPRSLAASTNVATRKGKLSSSCWKILPWRERVVAANSPSNGAAAPDPFACCSRLIRRGP